MHWVGLFTLLCTFISGCASYQYQIVAPDGSSRIVPVDQDLTLDASPARLQMRIVENRCVVLIQNPQDKPISLEGGQSALVDPNGRSRVIASQLIPPGAHVKLVLPPLREYVQPRGPQIGIGFGMRVDAADHTDAPVRARYLQIGAGPMEYWEWDGAGVVSLVLSFHEAARGQNPGDNAKDARPSVSHTFRIERLKK